MIAVPRPAETLESIIQLLRRLQRDFCDLQACVEIIHERLERVEAKGVEHEEIKPDSLHPNHSPLSLSHPPPPPPPLERHARIEDGTSSPMESGKGDVGRRGVARKRAVHVSSLRDEVFVDDETPSKITKFEILSVDYGGVSNADDCGGDAIFDKECSGDGVDKTHESGVVDCDPNQIPDETVGEAIGEGRGEPSSTSVFDACEWRPPMDCWAENGPVVVEDLWGDDEGGADFTDGDSPEGGGVARKSAVKRKTRKTTKKKTPTKNENEARPTCVHCGKTFSRPDTLARHLREVCEKTETTQLFPCDICGWVSIRKDRLERHRLREHAYRPMELKISAIPANAASRTAASEAGDVAAPLEGFAI